MKNTNKLMIALALTLILSLVSLNVWAAPLHQTTIETFPDTATIEGIIPVTGGTYQVTLLGNCGAVGTVTRITDSEKEIGLAAEGFEFLTDGVKIELGETCSVKICYPYPAEYKEMDGGIFKWNTLAETWDILKSEISGDPVQICDIDEIVDEAVYVMLGK